MTSLISAMQTASAAMEVFSSALGVDQANVSNASTPGYAALKATILPIDLSGDRANASDFLSVSSTGSAFADASVRAASSQASASQTESQQLSPVNQLFDITGQTGILAALQQFGTAFANLSVTPNDPTLGAAGLTAAGNVASAFQRVATSLESQQTQVDANIQSTVSQINSLSSQIAHLNVQAGGAFQTNPGIDASLRSDLDQLSSLVDVTVTNDATTGAASVDAGGLPLVVGGQSYSLSADPSAAAGSQITSSAGGNSSAAISGTLGALLQVRNGTFDQLLGPTGSAGSLNTLASGFATRVNALLTSGVTAGGAAGVPIFVIADPVNAAATLMIDASVTANQLGLSTAGVAGRSNGIANQLAALPASTNAADQIGGLSAEGLFGSIAASVGQSLSDANNQSTADQTTLTSAQANRQQISGVSLDEEAVTITAYQRSWEAEAKVLSILDQLASDEVNLIK